MSSVDTRGKVTNNGDGTFSYDPNGAFASLAAGQSTTDSFLYTVKDAAGATSTATVAITITRQNDPPVAANVTGTVLEHGPATTGAASYTRRHTDDSNPLTLET